MHPRERVVWGGAIVALLVACGALYFASSDRREAANHLARIEKLEEDLNVAYEDRLNACQRGNVLRNVVHQFIDEASAARRRSADPADQDTAARYEALDALIWPYSPCDVLITPPSSRAHGVG